LWYPTLYATTKIRNASKSASAIDGSLQAIRLLLLWTQSLPQPIDLKQRFQTKNWLLESERDSLFAFLSKRRDKKSKEVVTETNIVPLNKNIERIRRGKQAKVESVGGDTLYQRLGYVAKYIQWLATKVIEEQGTHLSAADIKSIAKMKTAINKMRTAPKGRNQENGRTGLTVGQRDELLEIMEVGDPRNPFTDKRKVDLAAQASLQLRNQLIIWFGYYFGFRDGEVLNIRISDICGATKTVLVARRADAIEDKRSKKPKVKTRDRRLPFTNAFLDKVYDYITEHRVLISPARKHDYLFVTHKKGPTYGAPLSLSSVEKMVRKIRASSEVLTDDMSMHVLRHDSNERFSEMIDKKNISPEKEKKMRSYQYGWKPTSDTAATYTKRHTQKDAHEVSLILQEDLEKRNKTS
jgi:integrase